MFGQSLAALCTLAIVLIVGGCASGPPPGGSPEPAGAVATAPGDESLPPPGFGTLRQDDFTVAFQSGDTQIKLTPLDEEVIRLAAPDTYQRLHGLAGSRMDQVRELSRQAGLREEPRVFLVSFFTYAQQAEFRPTELQIVSKGILYRPQGILPLTPGWGREQVKQQETQSAVYVFARGIDLDLPFTLEYINERTVEWGRIVGVLEAERGRVVGRANP